MSQELRNYSSSIQRLKTESKKCGLSESEFKNIYLNSLQEIEKVNVKRNHLAKILKYKKYIIVLCVIIIVLWNITSIYSFILCNFQDYLYPGLRLLRRLAIPFITLFPSITNWYDESCLIQNPFFNIVDMDCWPCSSISNVKLITDPHSVKNSDHTPFIYQTNQEIIDVKKLKEIFIQNKAIFEFDSANVILNNKHHVTPNAMFKSLLTKTDEHNLFIWKFNNMDSARILRQYIPRPLVVPKFGQSTERFLIIDSSTSTFKMPDTECNFSFVLSIKGNRKILLKPSDECKQQCKSLQIDLLESHLLWYNWWYWRPFVSASSHNDTFIAHLGSYC